MNTTERRTFLKQTAALGMGAPFLSLTSWRRHLAPSDRLNLGLIGCRGRGFHVLEQHLKIPGVQCLALCDVDANVLGERRKTLEEKHGQQAAIFRDFRRMLEQKDIDAVIIGTPDHWHCLPMVYACQAGKDVYVEKPMANSLAACDLMVAAARRYKRIVQVGQQQRSSEVFQGAMAYLKAGHLGPVRKARIWAHFNYGLGPTRVADTAVPHGIDYETWLGPAPARPFNQARFHGSWRFFWDYGGGLMTDWGVHLIDLALWARDITTPPPTVLAYGNQNQDPGRSRETYDNMSVIYPMEDYIIEWEQQAGVQHGPYDRLYGIAFQGERGTLVVDRGKWEVFSEWDGAAKKDKIEPVAPQQGEHGHHLHCKNFVEAVKNREEPACTVEMGRTVAQYAHMANIAVRTGVHKLEWDAEKGKFKGNSAANRLIQPRYRKPWSWPEL